MNRAAFAVSSLVFALACTTPSPGDEEVGEDTTGGTEESGTDTTAGTEDDTTGDGDTTTGVEPLATVSGKMVDMQGGLLPGPAIQLCGPIDDQGTVESCLPAVVDEATGEWSVNAFKVGLFALKSIQGPAEGRYFSGQSFQITIAEGDMLDLSEPPIVIPETDTVTDVSGAMGVTDVDIDGIVTVSLDPSKAQTPDFIAPTAIGGLQVAEEFWRVSEVDGVPIIAAWAFTPFSVHATEGTFGFSINDALGLAAADPVNVYAIQKDNGVIHHVATGTVNMDATAIDITPTAEGLHELSWLLVTPG